MNYNIYQQLTRNYRVNCVQGVNPPYNASERVLSKLKRLIGGRGIFPAFSNKRLTQIRNLVKQRINTEASINFYHGSTPWLNITQDKPYALYTDCCFATYINVYHNPASFSSQQLNWLYEKEKKFYENAVGVFFSSAWALRETKKMYKLNGANFFVAGLGSGIEADVKSITGSQPFFLFIALDFSGKGGVQVISAFKIVAKKYPEFSLRIIGKKPDAKYLNHPNIRYDGLLDKSNPEELKKLQELYANAYCLLLPTAKDITPLVLIEAASFGCPAIATNSFGIPEIVLNGETGILIPSNFINEHLASVMTNICENTSLRNKMGKNAAIHIQQKFTWDKTGEFIYSILSQQLPG